MAETSGYLPRVKMMIGKLYEQVSMGHIDNEWSEQFICDMKYRLTNDCRLTPKQIEKIEELFERY